MKLLVIANPGASHGRNAQRQANIQHSLEKFADVDWQITERAGHGTEIVASLAPGSVDGVVALGGDGTLFEVVNGLCRQERELRPPVGLIPAGTGNAFAQELGLSVDDWKKSVALIQAGHTRPVDVGRVKTTDELFYFVNIIGMGFVTAAGQASKAFKFMGSAAYTLGTLRAMLGLKSYNLCLEVDGQPLELPNIFIEISNTRYTGTSFLIAPQARFDDGLLDITLLGPISRYRLLRLFPTIYSGEHVHHSEVTTLQAKRIVLKSPAGFLLAPDGEFRGRTPAEITCLPRAIDVFAA